MRHTSQTPRPRGRSSRRSHDQRPSLGRRLAGLRWIGLGGGLAVVLVVVLGIATGAGPVGGVFATSVDSGDGDNGAQASQSRQTDGDEPIPDDGRIHDLQTLVAEHGEPGYADLGRLRIPLIGLDSPLSLMIVGEDGVMPTPQSPVEVAWYDLSGFPGVGGRPGEGNAIFAGHVDRVGPVDYADVEYSGPAAFWHLGLLGNGDEIEVEFGGQTLRYAVAFAQEVDASGSAWADVLSASHGDTITLITCSGDFDLAGGYSHRTVVRAERVG